jgi:hypothetical protein
METFIKDSSIPSGSVILAYGAPTPRSRILKILALVAGIFGALCVILLSILFFVVRVPVPEQPLALAFIPTSFRIPDTMPETWRTAQKASDPFPIFVGLERPEDGTLQPFAVTPKFMGWTYLGTTSTEINAQSFGSLAGRWSDYARGSWLTINWDGTYLSGPLTTHGWKTRTEVAKPSQSLRAILGDGYMNFSAFPEARLFIASALPQLNIHPSVLTDASAIRWTHGATSTGIAFDMPGPVTTEQTVRFGAAAGLVDEEDMELLDRSPAIFFHDPTNLFASGTVGTWPIPSGGIFRRDERSVTIETGPLAWNETRVPDTCPGDLLFLFEDVVPKRLFGVRSPNGRLSVCW